MGSAVRIQKRLAELGVASRREVERWIEAGRVTVNGERARLGARVSAGDDIRVDGRRIVAPARSAPRTRVLLYHKPVGEVCTRVDEEQRPTVFDALPRGRWLSVGRLDINTSGALLFTNNGELAHRLMHPSFGLEREYAVRIHGEVTPAILRRLRRGVTLADGPARFTSIVEGGGPGANRWFHVVLREGRSREVRRLWESQALEVSRLIRVRFGSLVLDRTLRAGKWKELDEASVSDLLQSLGLSPL